MFSTTSATRFKELCFDVTEGQEGIGRFWSAATGVPFHPGATAADPGDLVGHQEGMGVALCPVPEAKTVKNRVHLDVSVGSLEELIARGATVQEQHEHWTVMIDPVGNEFCAFVREGELPDYRVFEVVVDSVDPEAITQWWADVFAIEAHNKGEPWWWLQDVPGAPTAGPYWAMVFGPVPDPKTVKNRLHWDVYGDPAALIARGATHLWDVPGTTRPIAWTVLADPEGNEFCVFPPGDAA